jgi:hypothetical protein
MLWCEALAENGTNWISDSNYSGLADALTVYRNHYYGHKTSGVEVERKARKATKAESSIYDATYDMLLEMDREHY